MRRARCKDIKGGYWKESRWSRRDATKEKVKEIERYMGVGTYSWGGGTSEEMKTFTKKEGRLGGP